MNQNYKFAPDPITGTLSSDDTKKYISRFALAVFALGMFSKAAALICQFALQFIFETFGINAASLGIWADILGNVLSVLCIYAVGLPAFVVLSKPLPKVIPYRERMSTGKFFAGICVAFLFMTVGSYISNVFITFFSTLRVSELQNPVDSMVSQESVWITIIFIVIIGPILEELLFRKLICDKLLPLGEGYAIFLSASIFGLIHGNFFQFAYAFFVGALFALIYVKTGKLIYTTIYHMLINFLGSVVAPAVIQLIDIDKLNEMLNAVSKNELVEIDPSVMLSLLVLLAYEGIMMIISVLGLVFFIIAYNRREIKLQSGILPTPKKGRLANIFLNVGTAALITYFAVTFLFSLLQNTPQ